MAREAGALGALQIALNHLAQLLVFEGELDAAAALMDETDSIITRRRAEGSTIGS